MSMSDMSGMTDMGSTTGSTMMGKMYLHGSTGSDIILFSSWMPSSSGAYGGACVALFILAIGYRYLHMMKRTAEGYWKRDALSSLATAYPPNTPSSQESLNSDIAQGEKSFPDPAHKTPSPAYQSNEHNNIEPVHGSLSTPPFRSSAELQPLTSNSNPASKYLHLPRLVRNNLDPAREGRALPFIWKNELSRGALETITTTFQYALMLVVMTFQIWFILSIVIGFGVGEILFGRYGH